MGYSTVGKTGIESLANFELLRSHTNLIEQTADEIMGRKSVGDNVVTTLNVNLQQIASDALGKHRGAVIAIEPDTGKILCMVSKPSFDPNTVAANWNDLVNGDSTEARMLNRATQGLYPPGSTFKIVTALEYMREHPGAYNDYHLTAVESSHLRTTRSSAITRSLTDLRILLRHSRIPAMGRSQTSVRSLT